MSWSGASLGPGYSGTPGTYSFDGSRGASHDGGAVAAETRWGLHWREKSYAPGGPPPSHLVVFDRITPRILPFLAHFGYARLYSLPHAIVSDEGRAIEVWSRLPGTARPSALAHFYQN